MYKVIEGKVKRCYPRQFSCKAIVPSSRVMEAKKRLEKVTYDGKNRFASVHVDVHRVRTPSLSPQRPPPLPSLLKNLPEPSTKLPNDAKREKSSKTHTFLFSSKTIQLLLRHRSKH